MYVHRSRAAGPVTISRPNAAGKLVVVETRPAGTLETCRCEAEVLRRGPKTKEQKAADANRFAQSENWY